MKSNNHDSFIGILKTHLSKLGTLGLLSDSFNVVSAIIKYDKKGVSECVSLGIGTKSTSYVNLTNDGSILHDMHAEVLCRRGFIRYLYDELFKSLNNISDIFIFKNNQFKLIPTIEFHLIVSEAFCGDASVILSVNDLDENFLNLNQTENFDHIAELGRTGAKSVIKLADNNEHISKDLIASNGLPVRNAQTSGLLRYKPGKGDPSYSLSCSDKLLRWCCLGIQGSLLSSVIKQRIFLKSIVVTMCKRSRISFERSLIHRLVKFRNSIRDRVKNDELIHLPEIIFSNEILYQYKSNKQSSFFVMCWNKSQNIKEVIVRGYKQGFTRNTDNTLKMSSLSQKNFQHVFKKLMKEIGHEDLDELNYLECKNYSRNINSEFKLLEDLFFKYFHHWTRNEHCKYQF